MLHCLDRKLASPWPNVSTTLVYERVNGPRSEPMFLFSKRRDVIWETLSLFSIQDSEPAFTLRTRSVSGHLIFLHILKDLALILSHFRVKLWFRVKNSQVIKWVWKHLLHRLPLIYLVLQENKDLSDH